MIKKYAHLIKYILIIVFVLAFVYQCDKTNQLKTRLKATKVVAQRNLNNYKASLDTIDTLRNVKGDLVSSVRSFEFEVNNLSTKNKKLLEDVRRTLNVNQKLTNIKNTLNARLEIKDSLLEATTQITYQNKDSIQLNINDQKKWDKYNWRKLNADITLNKKDNLFTVTNSSFLLEQGLSLQAAVIDIDGRKELKISTPYPGINFTQIKNVNIVNDKLNPALQESKNWGLGIGLQYGLDLNTNQSFNTGATIGIGIYYSPTWLRW